MTVTGFIFVIWLYYAGSIGLIEMIFNYYHDFTSTLRWVTLRRPYLTLQFFMLRELLITNDTHFDDDVESHLQRSYEYESKIQAIKISGSTIMPRFKDLSLKLDSQQFCDSLSNTLGTVLTEKCKTFNESSMARGMQNNIFQMFSDVTSLVNLYKRVRYSPYSVTELLQESKWNSASIFLITM